MNKFCIFAAGRGTRNNNIDGLHKALLPIENKPTISYIIEKFDKNDIYRPKMGFAIPLVEWLRGPLKEWASDLINQPALNDGVIDTKEVKKIMNKN